MVEIHLEGGTVVFEPRGWSKLWTLRSRVAVPLTAVQSVRPAPPELVRGVFKGWRLPGTHLPGVITAGSYYRNGEWSFWDVRGSGRRAIEVVLAGTHFRRLVVDVDDPEREIRRLRGVTASSSSPG